MALEANRNILILCSVTYSDPDSGTFLPIMAYMGRLRLKGEPFQASGT